MNARMGRRNAPRDGSSLYSAYLRIAARPESRGCCSLLGYQPSWDQHPADRDSQPVRSRLHKYPQKVSTGSCRSNRRANPAAPYQTIGSCDSEADSFHSKGSKGQRQEVFSFIKDGLLLSLGYILDCLKHMSSSFWIAYDKN